jgi:hypothetical protein
MLSKKIKDKKIYRGMPESEEGTYVLHKQGELLRTNYVEFFTFGIYTYHIIVD